MTPSICSQILRQSLDSGKEVTDSVNLESTNYAFVCTDTMKTNNVVAHIGLKAPGIKKLISKEGEMRQKDNNQQL